MSSNRDPCLYLVVDDPAYAGCHLGHGLTRCPGCQDYRSGLNRTERQRCEVWTRVMGYHRPVSQWNAGKQAEHRERKMFRDALSDTGTNTYTYPPAAGYDL